MSNWYDCIEEPVRDLVKLLRENGINTNNSCGHEMTIQTDLVLDGQLSDIHKILYHYLTEKGLGVTYTIDTHLVVKDGWRRQYFADIYLEEVGIKPLTKEGL